MASRTECPGQVSPHSPPWIYLDHNATSPLLPEVAEAMYASLRAGQANPASQHELGRQARRIIEDAREFVAAALGADVTHPRGERLIFTSGGTEANNLAVMGLAGMGPAGFGTAGFATAGFARTEVRPGARAEGLPPAAASIWVSPLEHPSVAAPIADLARRGVVVHSLRVQADGTLDLTQLPDVCDDRPQLACLMLGNHETGVLQPVAELAQRLQPQGCFVHTDAVQAVGKMPVDFRRLGVTSLAFAAHKLGGPLGIGGLLVRRDAPLRPCLWGGFQQEGFRPGTESVPLVVGLRAALEIWQREAEERRRTLLMRRELLESLLLAGDPQAEVHGGRAPRLPHTLSISFPGVDRQALVMALDFSQVAVSTGSACQSGSSEPSSVLRAMGVPAGALESAIRLSLGLPLREADVREAARRILAAVHDLRHRSATRKSAASARHAGPKRL